MDVRLGYKQTEVGVIPTEWEVPFLRQQLLQDATYGVVKAGTFQRTGIPMLRGGDIKNGSITEDQPLITVEKSKEYSRTVLKEKDVVIALVGYPGETAVIPNRLVGANISRAVGLLRPAGTLRPEFLACYLNSPNGRKEFLRPSAGSAQIVVNLGALNRLRLPLPPVPEQRAIATALSDVDALLGGLDRLIAKKRDLKEAAMQQLLTGQTRLPGFHGEWEVKRLGDFAHIKTGSRNNEDKIEDGEYPFFVRSEIIERINTYSHDCEAILVPGEGRIGDIFHYINGRFDVHQRVYAITQFKPGMSAKFVHFYMAMRFGAWAMQNTVKATVDSLRLPTFQTFEMRVPPTKEEQTAIAAVFSDMHAEIAALEERRDKTRDLKQAMMQELLTGKTRLVPAGGAHA
jgi:type I restriction enzyme, S subunit